MRLMCMSMMQAIQHWMQWMIFYPEAWVILEVDQAKKWQCVTCTFTNHAWNDRCEICSALQQSWIVKFHSDLSLWRTDFEKFIKHQIIDHKLSNPCSIPTFILMIILEYIYDEIQSILQYPTQWIIQTTLSQTQSLQPFYKNRTSEDLTQISSRKSWSLHDTNIIFKQLIDEIELANIIRFLPQKILSKYECKHLFHEIVVYEPGGYFGKHVDSMVDEYDYTLLLILPTEYEGGELLIEDKVIRSNPSAWQSILFYKHIEHECKEILSGYKIVFKMHFCFGDIDVSHGGLTDSNLAYEPSMAYEPFR
eukprot:352605_1